MKPIEIYTTQFCGYCVAAKRLLMQKGATFSEIDVSGNAEKRQEMMSRSNGRHTVPQIFVGEIHVGGFDELAALDRRGALDNLLEH